MGLAEDEQFGHVVIGMGETQATPTANTLLRRLKDLLTGITLASNSGVDIGDVDVASIAAGTNVIGKTSHDITGIGHGVKVVTTAGTDVALAASTAAKLVIIQAQTDNTNKIAVGATGVDATEATGTGIMLDPGDTVTIPCDDLADIFIDSLVNLEGVRFIYFS